MKERKKKREVRRERERKWKKNGSKCRGEAVRRERREGSKWTKRGKGKR